MSLVTNITSPSAAPVPAPAAQVVSPVDTALNKLTSLEAVNNLWKTNVTDASFLMKAVGLVKYLLGKSEALKADATAVEFNNASAALVNAVANRYFTIDESKDVNLAGGVALKRPMSEAEKVLQAKTATETFYASFKNRCTALKVDMNGSNFPVYASAATKGIQEIANSTKTDFRETLNLKLKTAFTDFNEKIYKDMVSAYATQDVASITPDSFKEKVKTMKAFFADNNVVTIEASIRTAVKAAHNDIGTLGAEFINASADNAHVTAARTALKTNLEAQKTEIEAELTVLNGTWFNGTLEPAFNEQRTAQAELLSAQTDFVAKFNAAYSVNSTTPVAQLILLDLSAKPELATAKQKLIEANTNFEAKDKVAQGLHNRKVELEGKQRTVNAGLVDAELSRVARAETTKIGDFYTELNIPVGGKNIQARSTALHRIIGY